MGFLRQARCSGLPFPFSIGPRFVRTPHHDSFVLGGPTWQDPDAGKDRGQEKQVTADEMVGWHH